MCWSILHIRGDKSINQLRRNPSSAHACTLRNQNAHSSRTHTRAPFVLALVAPLKNRIQGQRFIKLLLSRKCHAKGTLRATDANSVLSQGAIELGALRGYNQSASSSLLVFFQLFPRYRQKSAQNGEYQKHFLYFPICNLICLVNMFWTVFMLIRHFLKQFGAVRCSWCWNTSSIKLSSLASVTDLRVFFVL